MESDPRFLHITTDPKFRRIPKLERKVKIDKRFRSMFRDKQFKIKYTTDKRGRPIKHTSNEDLKRYYELSSSAESESDSDSEIIDGGKETTKEENKESSAENGDSEVGKYVRSPPEENQSDSDESAKTTDQLNIGHKSDKKLSLNIKEKLKNLKVDYARGESRLLSESSSDSEGSESEDSEETFEHAWGELDHDAERTDEITNRLAVCNMDWDRIRATDLMVLFNSFLPPGGLIHSVTIYPSEFGIKRMQEEEVKGPIELVERNDIENVEETSEGSKYHMEKLRQYQLNRLKYYYAVVVCDSVSTANKIYTECDGLEYESSATKIDLRFIPDDIGFDQEPKETCDKLPEQDKYQPRFFTTTALQQAKVDLTWDETDPKRIEVTEKLINGAADIPETDLQAYLASSSGDEESEEDGDNKEQVEDDETKNPIDKYKSLLQEIEKKEEEKKKKDVELEITWGIGLKEKTEKLVKEKIAEREEKTPFQEYLEKRKEKRKAKRENAKKNKNNSESDDDSEDSVEVDMSDSYFAEEFQSGEFQKKAKKKSKASSSEDNETDKQKKAELELLLLNNEDDGRKHFSLKKLQETDKQIRKKRKNKKGDEDDDNVQHEDNFQINVNDERFSALYSSHHFNLDPTDPHFKKTKGMDLLVNEKLKRRNEMELKGEIKKSKVESKMGTELNMLVKSVKQKTKMLNRIRQAEKLK